MLYYDRDQLLQSFRPTSWEFVLFSEMEATLTSKSRPFPCVFGVAGFQTNNLRFTFFDRITPQALAPVLQAYLPLARSTGPKASLVVFEQPSPVENMDTYRDRFWELLDGLARIDESPWPREVPESLDHPLWEFCFAGEPIFVVCNTPAHVQRQSRRSSGFTITFQPRWVFEGITHTESAANAAFSAVRNRLVNFDTLGPAPALGRYGDQSVREYAQYFIDDKNTIPGCPMKALALRDGMSTGATEERQT